MSQEELKPITAADAGFDADEPNIKGLFLFLVATVALFIVVAVGVTYYFNYAYGQVEQQQLLGMPSEQLAELRAREAWNLTHYGYLDKAKGQVRLPINRAMELITSEAASGKPKYPQVDQAPKKVEPAPASGAPAAAPVASGK